MLSPQRLSFLCLAITCLLWTTLGVAASDRPTPKPLSPVTVSIAAETELSPGEPISFEVTASTKIMADEFTIFVQAPNGASLREGELFWRGPLQRGASKTIRFTLSLPTQGVQEITAVARIQQAGRPQYAARAVYRAGQSISRAAAKSQQTDKAVKRSQRGGRSVIEYPLNLK